MESITVDDRSRQATIVADDAGGMDLALLNGALAETPYRVGTLVRHHG